MRASILTIGDELLIGQILNSNVQWMGEMLTHLGVQVTKQLTVGDVESEIIHALDYLVPASDFLIVGGGLGPTHDDITMNVLSHYAKIPLAYDLNWISQMEIFFKSRNRPMTENNKKQGFLLKGANRIDNDCGTAAGQHFKIKNTEIFVVPGVPHEMKSMMSRYILPFIEKKNPGERILKTTLLTTGSGESALATRCDPFVKKVKSRPDLTLAFLPNNLVVKLRLQMKSAEPGAALEFESLVDELENYCGKDFFGVDPTSLQEVTVQKLIARKQTVSLAESCTGGLIAHLLTQVPGSSSALKGGLIAYQNEIKIKELKISEAVLESEGVVSETVAKQMAENIRQKWNTDFALSTTGYLGPNGGDTHSPVGTVWIALASVTETRTVKFNFENHRERSKERAAQAAIDLLRRAL
jgi:nicotinamide-nucleotide amidase